jgi:hypothetical protein
MRMAVLKRSHTKGSEMEGIYTNAADSGRDLGIDELLELQRLIQRVTAERFPPMLYVYHPDTAKTDEGAEGLAILRQRPNAHFHETTFVEVGVIYQLPRPDDPYSILQNIKELLK